MAVASFGTSDGIQEQRFTILFLFSMQHWHSGHMDSTRPKKEVSWDMDQLVLQRELSLM